MVDSVFTEAMSFEKMQFCYPWREYQARVLEELKGHLDDERLHVVAAPGSGKTVLGLEVMRRLECPTLILAPTRAIRDQWIDRLVTLFLSGEVEDGWISRDLRKPAIVTVTTYQALHAASKRGATEEDEEEDEVEEPEALDDNTEGGDEAESFDILQALQGVAVGTLVLDEAHHLRHAWWKALRKVQQGIESVRTVSLTATPPYDVDTSQWQRYEELCGPIDAWIHVPELVSRGDLCPHQDHLFLIVPTEEEEAEIARFHQARKVFADRLLSDVSLGRVLVKHPWIQRPEQHVESILGDPEFFSGLLIHGAEAGRIEPEILDRGLKMLGVGVDALPPFDLHWQEIFLRGFLQTHKEEFHEAETIQKELRRELKRIGALERNQIQLQNPRAIRRLLFESLGKLDAMVEIVRQERLLLGDGLRMVILSDFVRREEMPRSGEDLRTLGRLGVVPIFETLRRARFSGLRLGVLTGSLIVLPVSSRPLLEAILEEQEFDLKLLRANPLPHDEEYLEIRLGGAAGAREVALVTEVFGRGGLDVLVGTQALLGEGWDAPSINSLILATFVGSYMLSNQMRGRAIRTDKENPDKTASIWHLAALETVRPEVHSNPAVDPDDLEPDLESLRSLGPDLVRMVRRFQAFEGPSWEEPITIETGIGRIGLPGDSWNMEQIQAFNDRTFERSRKRGELQRLWSQGIRRGGANKQFRETLETSAVPGFFGWPLVVPSVKWFTGVGVAATALSWIGWAMAGPVGVGLLLGGMGFALFSSEESTPSILLRNRNRAGRIRQLGRTVLESLVRIHSIQTPLAAVALHVQEDPRTDQVICGLEGVSEVEQRLFLQSMETVLSPIDNPRYLLVRRFRVFGMERTDYHAVPTVLGRKKEEAVIFADRFSSKVGPCELVYTRSEAGRRSLLLARSRCLSAFQDSGVQRKSVWN